MRFSRTFLKFNTPIRPRGMDYWIRILVFVSALSLNACAFDSHTLIPDGPATAGQLQHASVSTGTLEIHYAGNRYVGEFVAESSHHILGEHERFPGRIARPVLVAPNGDRLTCEVQWARLGKPAGVCTDRTGKSFDVRFE